MTDVFISYARADDEPFVKRLYEDLTAHGFEVWWDRVSMPSRALTFLQEIRDAIDSADRLILIVGPKAVESDYVSAEWQYALNACKVVTPILRIGDYNLLPDDLAKLHCPNFRETRSYDDALAELLRILGEPVVPLGALRGVPSLPPHFLPRPEEMAPLAETILADVRKPTVITSAKQTTALQGMGGVGKSVLAAAFARACETRRAFTDGVIWLTFGQQPDLVRNMALMGQAFNDDPQHYLDLSRGKVRLSEVLADKVCLLVLDDIWDVAHAEAFVNALGARCRMLITTRDGGLATALGAQEHWLDVLSDDAALRLLADWSELSVDAMPPETRAVADECGNLPFALALCGAMARDGIPWAGLLNALRKADLTFIEKQFPNYPYPDVLKSLKVSVDALARTDPASERHYLELAVFPADEAVPEAAVLTLWLHTDGMNKREARKLLATLERKALLRLEGEAPQRCISLHDLQHDYLYAAQDDLISLHRKLLDAYRQKCADGWHTGPDDGYFFGHLAHHLVETGREEELRRLLFDFDWLQAKLEATDATALIADFDFLADDTDLRLVQGAIQLAAHVLAQDKTQLAGHLLGRLLSYKAPEIRAMLERARLWQAAPWLRPLSPSLMPPGGPLLRTLTGHTGSVGAVAITPDGRRAVSASSDTTLKVWDLENGAELRTLTGHSDEVWAVTITPDGGRAVSASYDCTLKVWDLESGAELLTLTGHSSYVNAVAITPDGRQAVSASGGKDKTLKVWDLESGAELQTLTGHTGSISAVAITPDGRWAVSASHDYTLKVWDLESGAELRTLTGHSGLVEAVAITPDGRRAVSASSSHLKVWDLESGAELRTLTGHSGLVEAVAITPDGRRAVSAAGSLFDSSDNTLKVWDLENGAELQTLTGHSSYVNAVAITPDGRRAVSASSDRTIKVWDLESRAELLTLTGHSAGVRAVAIAPDGRRAVSASSRHLKVWDLKSRAELRTLTGHSDSVEAVALTPDGQRAVSASEDLTLKVWDLESGAELRTLTGHGWYVNAVAITPDGRQAVSASDNRTLKVWDLESGAELRTLTGHSDGVWAVAITPDGGQVVSASHDRTLKVWDLESGKVVASFSGESPLETCTVAPDGVTIIAGEQSGRVHILRLEGVE